MPAATRRQHGSSEKEAREGADSGVSIDADPQDGEGAGSQEDRRAIGLTACTPRSMQRPPIGGLFYFEVAMDAAAAGSGLIVTPRRTHVAHAWMTAFPFAELQAEADRRRLHPDALAARILEKVLCRGMVDELLDR